MPHKVCRPIKATSTTAKPHVMCSMRSTVSIFMLFLLVDDLVEPRTHAIADVGRAPACPASGVMRAISSLIDVRHAWSSRRSASISRLMRRVGPSIAR